MCLVGEEHWIQGQWQVSQLVKAEKGVYHDAFYYHLKQYCTPKVWQLNINKKYLGSEKKIEF